MKKKLIALSFAVMGSHLVFADNPIVQTKYTSDPAPMVASDGKLYVYTGHDEDGSTWYTMNDWQVFSTEDMVNWTEYPSPMGIKTVSWANGSAWAAQCCEKNGRYYWYFCANKTGGSMAIGVATSNSPSAKFRSMTSPLSNQFWGEIDPTVLIDDDGKAYLYWGNPDLYCAELASNMIRIQNGPYKVDLTRESFGGYKEKYKENGEEKTRIVGKDCYEEGPWIMKRDGMYYLVYAAGGVPEHISYSTSASPLGPWTYRGIIMPTQGGSFTNHPGVVEYKGHWYFFYHNGALPGGGGFTRSVCVEEFHFNQDGSFPTINMTTRGPDAIGTLNPFERVEAETMATSKGVKSDVETGRGVYIKNIDRSDYIRVREVDFGEDGAKSITVAVKSDQSPGKIRVQVSGMTGYQATIDVPQTLDEWTELSADFTNPITGKHDVTFSFTSSQAGATSNLFFFDYWQCFPQTVGITEVNAAKTSSLHTRYFTLDGREVRHPQKGITIVVRSDGTVSKVYHNPLLNDE